MGFDRSAKPPVAEKIPYSFSRHGITVTDDYAWLRDPGYPEVGDEKILGYLNAENAYFEAAAAPLKPLIDELFAEIKAAQPEEDSAVPWKDGAFWYRWRFEKGAEYRLWERAPGEEGPWTLLYDEPAAAKGHDYFRLGALSVSPDGTLLAYSTDTDGSEKFTLRIRNIKTGEELPGARPMTIGEPVWASDSKSLLYLELNENWRPEKVFHHKIEDNFTSDTMIYQEPDAGFFVSLSRTSSRDYILIHCGDHETSEVRIVPAAAPLSEPRLAAPRRPRHEYHMDHGNGRWIVRSNAGHVNFGLFEADEAHPEAPHWSPLISGSDSVYITGVRCFDGLVAIEERENGLDQIRLLGRDGESHRIRFPEPAYAAHCGMNAEFAITHLRVSYESMVTPRTVYDYDLARRELVSRKVQEIPSGYDASAYRCERLYVEARDGIAIPVSIVFPRDFPRDGTGPLHLYGYGAYGIAIPPGFSASRLSLLKRGVAFAIAHIRGGDDLGYQWYLDGKLEKRVNTFNDFVDAARALIEKGWTSPALLTASGGSAGGELMGAVMNQAPELFAAIAAHVPFVDVLNTMLDGTLPLTPHEWKEWGDPGEDKAAFELIRSYSPYDRVEAKAYPALFITAGLNDPRVTYWEPAKWAAKLRAMKTDDNILLLKTNMGAGHGGISGRFASLREVAEEYAFLLTAAGNS